MNDGYSALARKRRKPSAGMDEEMEARALAALHGVHDLMVLRESRRRKKQARVKR